MNKAAKQSSVAAQETEAASCVAWERRANAPLPIGKPKLLHRDRYRVLCWYWGHPLRALEALESLWMLSQAGCSPRELLCHKNRAAYSL